MNKRLVNERVLFVKVEFGSDRESSYLRSLVVCFLYVSRFYFRIVLRDWYYLFYFRDGKVEFSGDEVLFI